MSPGKGNINTSDKGTSIERIGIKILEAEGYKVHRCVRTGQKRGPIYVSNGNDIFGCVDLLAKRKGERMRFIQVTSDRAITEKIEELMEVPWDNALESVEIWRWVGGEGKHTDGRNGKIRDRCYFQVYLLDDGFQLVSQRRIRTLVEGRVSSQVTVADRTNSNEDGQIPRWVCEAPPGLEPGRPSGTNTDPEQSPS